MKVAEGIFRVEGVRGNVYLLSGEKLMLVDTGMPGSGPKIVRFIREELKRDEHELSMIVLTHQHIDHAGSALWLKGATRARIAIHEDDADYVSGRREPLRPKGAAGVAFAVFSPFFKLRTFDPDLLLRDGEMLGPFRIVHIPGHTPGSIAICDDANGLVFSGDIVSTRSGRAAFPPRSFNSDGSKMRESLSALLSRHQGLLLPGHGEPVRSGVAARLLTDGPPERVKV